MARPMEITLAMAPQRTHQTLVFPQCVLPYAYCDKYLKPDATPAIPAPTMNHKSAVPICVRSGAPATSSPFAIALPANARTVAAAPPFITIADRRAV
ncbi:hypothetical protein EMIT0111MI5_150013 [Burkholderia sp. IT-111MI5]